MSLGLLTALSLTASAHVPDWAKPLEINPALGVPGFPDCERDATLAAAGAEPEMALRCAQKEAKDEGVISIGCVGDSITAGVCSTGGKCVTPSWPPTPTPLRCAATPGPSSRCGRAAAADTGWWRLPQPHVPGPAPDRARRGLQGHEPRRLRLHDDEGRRLPLLEVRPSAAPAFPAPPARPIRSTQTDCAGGRSTRR